MIKNYPDEKYKIYTDNKRRVVAVSTYAGKKVRGEAICDEADTFDFNIGKEIAIARCNYKVAIRRAERAYKKAIEAKDSMEKAYSYFKNMESYLVDANNNLDEASKRLALAIK